MNKKIKQWIDTMIQFRTFFSKNFTQKKVKKNQSISETAYFVEARSWADDLYTAAVISRNRYKMAFFIAMGLAILLTIAVNALIPLQHIEPFFVNHYPDGHISVQPPTHQKYAPTNEAQVKSEIVRYVVNRESFDATSYDNQYSLINLLSNNEVAREYIDIQSIHNEQSLINQLGKNGNRTVHVENVIFLDSALKNQGQPPSKQTHYDLAQVDFTITDQFSDSVLKKTQARTALIAWTYRDMPNDPGELWRNWNGFTATRYTVEQRNVAE